MREPELTRQQHRHPRECRRGCVAVAALLAMNVLAAESPDDAPLQVQVSEPRAFGYRLGDTVEREVRIDVPRRLRLDEDSLPKVGPQAQPAIELHALERSTRSTPTGSRLTLKLHYQVFASPVGVRTYELPVLKLSFQPRTDNPGARAEDLRVDAWPLVVSTIASEEASTREGLGELRPDTTPPARPTQVERLLLWICAAVGGVALIHLALVYLGLPWWGRRHRPFGVALRRVVRRPGVDVLDACRALHGAINQTAGHVVFAESLDDFIARAPSFAPLRTSMQSFFARSQAAFYGGQDAAAFERDWLLAFARACRDAERGTA